MNSNDLELNKFENGFIKIETVTYSSKEGGNITDNENNSFILDKLSVIKK